MTGDDVPKIHGRGHNYHNECDEVGNSNRPFTVFNYIFNGFTTKIVGRRTKRAGYELHVYDNYRVELNMMLFWLWGGDGTGRPN